MDPVASTGPGRKWPRMRASARIGRSMFTTAPRFSEPRADTRMVSGDTSMCTPLASAETTVKQTPFTATESPAVSSVDKDVISRRRNPDGVGLTSATSPRVSMSPVNISLYQQVLAEPHRAAIPQTLPRHPAFPDPLQPPWPEGHGGDVEVDLVDEGGVPRGPGERGATLEQQ